MKALACMCALVMSVLLSACSTMTPARYIPSADTNLALDKLAGAQARVMPLGMPADPDVNCRMMGPVKPADGMTIGEFVAEAFNTEFKYADIYAVDGITLSGNMDRVEFSSIVGLTSGRWDLALTLNSSNGQSISTQNLYEFKSGFDAITACNQTAQALGTAVQELVRKTVTDSRFPALLQP
ncbi:MAG: hypothetical protein HKN58_00040 [Xanthomonadales bacterium]|nr:hypothetical protein [Xanthomonadales bacterium]